MSDEPDTAPEPEKVTIVLADDHVIVRDGAFAWFLKAAARHRSRRRGSAAEDAPPTSSGTSPTVLVLDLNMPGNSSLERSCRSRAAHRTPR